MQEKVEEILNWKTTSSSWLQALGPSLFVSCGVAIGIAIAGVWFLFLPRTNSNTLLHSADILAISIFFFIGIVASFLANRLRQANILRQLLTFKNVKESEEQFRLLAESIPQLAWMAMPDGRKFWFNQRWYDYTGITSLNSIDVKDFDCQEFQDPQKIEDTAAIWNSAIEAGQPFEMEYQLKSKIGSYRWFLTRVSPVKGEQGQIIRWFGTHTDIDEKIKIQEKLKIAKEEAEENAQRVRSLLDSTAEGIWGVAVGGRITFVNQAAIKLFGYDSADEIVGKNSHELVHYQKVDGSPYPQCECPIYKSFQDGSSVHLEDEVLWRKDGTYFYADYRSTPVFRNNKIVGAVTTFFDITERRVILSDLKIAQEAAEHANKLKSEFLANMSHEIRTPLGVIMGFADLIVTSDASAEDKLGFASVLRQNGQQLSVLINDILDLSKVEAGHLKIDVESFSLEKVIQDVFSTFETSVNEKKLKLNLRTSSDLSHHIYSDPVRISQVLWNLLGNAIKFTENGTITVEVLNDKNQIEIAIQDTGIGISERQRNNLFKPFSQGDGSITRKYGGTGLGLTLSRKLARLLGGDLVLDHSQPGHGSRFVFRFKTHPKKEAPTSKFNVHLPQALALPPGGSLHGTKVLVVEDSPDNQNLIVHLLEKKGITVTLANNGLEGVKKALHGSFDMLLMDIQMPVMDGYTATQKLRDLGYRKPILALTAHALSEVRKKCLAVGYTDYLTKPINSNDLFSTIEKYRLVH